MNKIYYKGATMKTLITHVKVVDTQKVPSARLCSDSIFSSNDLNEVEAIRSYLIYKYIICENNPDNLELQHLINVQPKVHQFRLVFLGPILDKELFALKNSATDFSYGYQVK